MAYAPGSAERRVNLIREMARQRDHSHSRGSGPSSVGSARDSIHDFDNASEQLPPLRGSNHQHADPRQGEDFQINTSALRRAFPDFSQNGSSEEDSIEFGRGARKSSRNAANKTLPSEDTTENVPFTMNDGNTYQITATPPFYGRNASKKATAPTQNSSKVNSLKRAPSNKENQDPAVKVTDFLPSNNKQTSQNGRQSLAEIHARIEPEDAKPSPAGRRPATEFSSTKNTRFGNAGGSHVSIATDRLPKTFKSANELLQSTIPPPLHTTPKSQGVQNGTIDSAYSAGTYQSFVLPDLPNLTELVSGVRPDGTPIVSHSVKRGSRFGASSQRKPKKPGHFPIDGIPIPEDEKALFLSLQLLQEKVADLETEKSQTQQKLEAYEDEIIGLKAKLQQRETSIERDSGIGTDADEGGNQNWEGDRTKLELSIKRLQDRLEHANKKVSVSEITVKNLTKDRNAAHSQLAVAHRNSEELQGECEKLHVDIETLKTQLKTMTRRHEKKIEKLTKQEHELRGKLERREKAVKEMSSLAKEIWNTRTALANTEVVHKQPSARGDDSMPREKLATGSTSTKHRLSMPSVSHKSDRHTQLRRRASAKALGSKFSRGYESQEDSTTNVQPLPASQADDQLYQLDLTTNSTYESFMEGDEVAKLRRILEADQAKLAGLRVMEKEAENRYIATEIDNPSSVRPASVPRKSSLKDLSKNIAKVGNTRDEFSGQDAPKGRRRGIEEALRDNQNLEHSVNNYASERQRSRTGSKAAIEMTSAFILPDVTLSNIDLASNTHPLTAAQPGKTTVTIPRPVPVSDRQVSLDKSAEDMTLRPAQHPAQALAMVLHELEEELTELRAQLSAQEKLYNQHDPSLERRKRKKVYAAIQRLLLAIEIRSERIYRLYDVLEGQKATGMLMTEDEVEVTLRDIGLDLAHTRLRSNDIKGGATNKNKKMVVIADDDSENDEGESEEDGESDSNSDDGELPWEGIEATQSLRSLPPFTVTLERF